MTMITDAYIRRAIFVDIIDGDTARLDVDCGFETFRRIRARVNGIDTAELKHDTTGRGQHARAVCAQFLTDAKQIVVQTHRKEAYRDEEQRTFERYVCDIWVDGALLADRLKAALTEVDGKWGTDAQADPV